LGPSKPSDPQHPLSVPADRSPRASSGWTTSVCAEALLIDRAEPQLPQTTRITDPSSP
jgi:hypothetical protein